MEGPLLRNGRVDRYVMEVIVRTPGTALDDIVSECQDVTWNQLFVVIDRLTR